MANADRRKTKREQKAAKRAAREAARRAERRRALLTAGIVGVVLLVGTGLIALTIMQESNAEATAEQEALEAASEAAREASEAAEELANREVACGADAPATATSGGDAADAASSEGADPAADAVPESEAADADVAEASEAGGSGAAVSEGATAGTDETAAPARPTFEEPEQVLEDGVDYSAVVTTSCGEVTIDLAEAEAPETVNSFVFLAQQGFFDGLEIFRNATSIGALQTGSGTNDATWQVGYTLPDELDLAAAEGYPAGSVAMANAGPNTGGSQFFFVYNDQFGLDPTFTKFGEVTEGLDVLEEIGAIETIGPAGETPGEIVYMERVEITEASAGQ